MVAKAGRALLILRKAHRHGVNLICEWNVEIHKFEQ
jgi:hypothetical protein